LISIDMAPEGSATIEPLRSSHPASPKVPVTTGTAFAAAPVRRKQQDKAARLYDEEIHPLFGQRFADMLLAAADIPPKSAILEIGCAAGAITAQIAHRLDAESRIVAVDASVALLELARARVRDQEHAGRRVFFRAHPLGTRLPFAEETFETVLANVSDSPLPTQMLADYVRVTKPGGQVVVAAPLRGTWLEFLDIFREVLVQAHRPEAIASLDAYVSALPEADAVARQLEALGLRAVDIEIEHWELVFRSAREFFYAPVIEHGPLTQWKEIVGREVLHETFLAIKDSIDTYFSGRAFAVSVFGGRFSARKP
jgi:ubiquinone/menaquinone biosynthesis C-methylase UbiE